MAAVIFQHKPVANDDYAHSFPFETTIINVTEKDAELTGSFTVKKDATD